MIFLETVGEEHVAVLAHGDGQGVVVGRVALGGELHVEEDVAGAELLKQADQRARDARAATASDPTR